MQNHVLSLRSLFVVSMLLLGARAQAYHYFVGYGYTSCMTCHFNGAGGGALNDYGRALFATEITSRLAIPNRISDEQLGETSQFLVKKSLPYWVRPAFKTRDLSVEANPGGDKTKRWIVMQREFHVTLSADQDQKYIFVYSMSQNDVRPRTFTSGSIEDSAPGWAMKDAYFRIQLGESNWIYAGQMDKVFGIRDPNHTLVARVFPNVTQYDQSMGLIFQRSKAPWEWFLNVFTGHQAEKSEYKLKGASYMAEYEPAEKMRVGFSVMTAKNEFVEKNSLAVHSKLGFEHGHSLSAEIGTVEKKTVGAASDPPRMGYGILQSLIRIDRGYNFLGETEWRRSDLNTRDPNGWKWSLGVLTFPLPRTEFRAALVNDRSSADGRATKESWSAQWQLHLSL